LRGRYLAAAVIVVAVAAAAMPVAGTACEAEVLAAGREAVQDVLGPDAEVTLEHPVCEGRVEQGGVRAQLQPGGRIGSTVRFTLHGEGGPRNRVGRLTATVQVHVPHVRARQAVAARATVDETQVVEVMGDPGRQPIVRLPRLSDVVGRRLKRGVAADEAIAGMLVDAPPLVKTGTTVTTVARVQGLEVRGRAVAAQDGSLGDTVQVVNPDSRKRLQGRVIGESVVEVLHVS
jgi:flagella basal body P-ring formation protein FlgA